ncbi:MAG: MBL fold metallo-hydrolase [Rhodoblastus sp.]|nr:MBL fold metallo-hydrolase [Rhodoblastus sp.]
MTTRGLYSGADVRLTTLANGAIANSDAQEKLERTTYRAGAIDQVAPGVTVFAGGFLNLTLIEGDDGLIVYDTGETFEDGERFLRQIRAISDKPIVAVIYSHSHYANGTTALVGDGRGARIIGHPKVNGNMASGGSGSLFPETAPLQISRTLQQFNFYSPESGPDAAPGAALAFGRSGFLSVDTPVSDGQRMTIAGVEMQFFTRYGSDTDDCLTVHLPATGVVLNNLFWPWLPNIYTLRGSLFRDPREWRDGLKVIRDLRPAALVGTHARSVKGAEAAEALDAVIDGLSAILDQTLRGILRGLGPDDLRSFVRLPRHLADHPFLAEIYGEISHFGPYLYNAALGWFDGDAASINPLPPTEQAERLVEAMGGAEAVFSLAQTAFAKKQLAWAAQLVGYLYRLDPMKPDVRRLKADALQQMGRITPAHTIRSWYIAQARALRGEATIPRLTFANTRVLALAPPTESMDQYRVRIDPDASGDMDVVVALSISDRNVRHAWHLRRGVVELNADVEKCRRQPDVEVETDYDNWLRFFSCKRSLDEFLEKATIRSGPEHARAFFAAFDFYEAADNLIVPR